MPTGSCDLQRPLDVLLPLRIGEVELIIADAGEKGFTGVQIDRVVIRFRGVSKLRILVCQGESEKI